MRRSSIRVSEVTWQHVLFSPYRCRECRKRFWVFSRNTYYLAGASVMAIAVGVVTAAIAWSVPGTEEPYRTDLQAVQPLSGALADVVKLAENNDPIAEYKLAQIYLKGLDVRKDEKAAQKWLERAAEHGNADAQYEFGLALREGRGVIQDFERAVKWLQHAAASGHARAQYELGRMYLSGTGLPADSVNAYMWLNLAAAGGIERAVLPRDAALLALSPAQATKAQAEARRLTETWSRRQTSEAK